VIRRRLALVGVALALVAGSCSLLPGGSGSYTVTVWFTRAISLYESSQVRVLGLPAGRVTEVEPVGDAIRVRLSIDGDVPVPADARAAIIPQSLIGERYVQLVPAWTHGDPRLQDGDEIPLERSSVPVEPDEALAALKEFLDTLDPDGAGRLVENAADALEGNGETLGSALGGLAELQSTLASEDQTLASIVDQLDRFTATLVQREGELGEVMDLFAEVTGALAAERTSIEALVGGLAQASTDGLDLVSRNATRLRTDIARLTTVVRTVEANLGAVEDLLSSGDDFAAGLDDAFNAEHRRIDLRNSFSPVVTETLDKVPGLPPAICLPIDVQCDPAPVNPGTVTGQSTGAAVPAHGPSQTAARVLLGLLGPTVAAHGEAAGGDDAAEVAAPSVASRVATGLDGAGRWLRRASASLLGVGG
jgi:phospholipid/cholesterol/gamma-HCH transport system substrate-binding protein